jgi:hypothetical protein
MTTSADWSDERKASSSGSPENGRSDIKAKARVKTSAEDFAISYPPSSRPRLQTGT